MDGDVEHSFPGDFKGGLKIDVELDVDVGEGGFAGEAEQAALVVVGDGAGEDVCVGGGEGGGAVAVDEFEEFDVGMVGLGVDELCGCLGFKGFVLEDGLADGESAVRFEDAVEFAEGGGLVVDVGEDGAGDDGVDGGGGDGCEVVGRCRDEGALGFDAAGDGELPGVVEEGLGDVGEDDIEGGSDAVDGSEGEEAVAGADVGEGLVGGEVSGGEYAVAVGFGDGAHSLLVVGVTAVAAVEEPLGPLVGGGLRCRLSLGGHEGSYRAE